MPDLVLEVVLVEQRALEQVEVPARAPVDRRSSASAIDVVLEEHRPEPESLGELEQLLLALGALEAVEHRRQLGLRPRARSSSTTIARPK